MRPIDTAVIVAESGETITAEEIQDYCRQYLAGYKIPRKVVITKQLSRNASGKLQKYLIREQLKA